VRIAVVTALVAMLAVTPASALAAPEVTVELQRESVRYGAAHRLTGALKDGAAPLAAQEVVLEGLRYPYEGSYRVIARAQTDEQGAFKFTERLDRNHRLRVVAPALNAISATAHAYTLPAFQLSFRALRPGVVRLYQRYTVPKTVRLKSPTLFYLGSRKAKRASKRVVAEVRLTSAGRYTSRADVELPARWNGAFKFASCFRPTPGAGMGDPRGTCPRLRFAF
jgi:hypothetical protein